MAPLVALLSLATLALVVAAQAGLSFCANRIAIDAPAMDAMAGMTMGANHPMHHPLLVCPVVLVLIIASTLLAAVAIAIVSRDPERELTRRTIARALSRLPVARAAATVSGFAAVAVVAMIAVDGAGIPNLATCALLAGMLLGGACAAVVIACFAARAVVALGHRLIVAIGAAIAARDAHERPFVRRRLVHNITGAATRLRAASRGLRAPPSFVH